jgi:hypothetical protein
MPNAKLKCCNCKDRFKRESMTKLPVGNFCSQDCIVEYAANKGKRAVKRQIAKKKKKDNLEKKLFNINDVKKQLELTQPVFNKLRRLQEFEWFKQRGLEPECISCGKKNMDWCNGHFKTVGSQGGLRFDPMNSYLQCNRYCNKGLSGNIEGNKNTRGYKVGLAERFGADRAKEIIEYCEIDQVRKWTGQELFEMRKEFNKQIRDLEA